ncbi:MAG: 30S ribosomal protein S4 [Nanoarchaeota archaeon]
MGDPRKLKKKYKTPFHPWKKERIEKEREILKEYGLKNKKEIWRAESKLKKYTRQAKRLIKGIGKQTEIERKQMISSLNRLNLIAENAKPEDVLNFGIKNILNRRLQSFVCRLGLARSMKQARQFITHGHIFVNGKKINVPSYIIKKDEEDKITFNPSSSLSSQEHSERSLKEEKKETVKEEPKE